jgi:hypothetical protein
VARETPSVDEALPAVRRLFEEAGILYKLVGGIAVVHHGYARMTEDIDVLVDGARLDGLVAHLAAHDFARESPTRLRHLPTGVRVDLLIAGTSMPRPGSPPYPSPDALPSSDADAAFVGLAPLLQLKLRAHRHQDLADVVALLQRVDDARYLELEAQTPRELRERLGELRRDALEELALQ